MKQAFGKRDIAHILPVGDVDRIAMNEHSFDGIPQQRGVVARQRRHNQAVRHVRRFGGIAHFAKTQQARKGKIQHGGLLNSHGRIFVQKDAFDSKLRLGVLFEHPVKGFRDGLGPPCGNRKRQLRISVGPQGPRAFPLLANGAKDFCLAIVEGIPHALNSGCVRSSYRKVASPATSDTMGV